MYYLLKWIKILVLKKKQSIKKILEKWEKNTGKVREFCQPGRVGTMKVLDPGIESLVATKQLCYYFNYAENLKEFFCF